jgi:hypothetical protein
VGILVLLSFRQSQLQLMLSEKPPGTRMLLEIQMLTEQQERFQIRHLTTELD